MYQRDQLQSLLEAHRPGFSLPRDLYLDEDVFQAEIETFLTRHWINVGHVSSIPNEGDYYLVELFGYELIVVRSGIDDASISVLNNVCRHRGSRVCLADSGNTRRFVCPYHSWSYGLDGTLASWRHMPDGLDKKDYGLAACAVAVFEGFILVAPEPDQAPDFAEMTAHVEPYWQRYDLSRCRVIDRETYVISANWKLAIENGLECYHCLMRHPEYASMHAFVRADEQVSGGAVSGFQTYHERWRQRMEACGVPTGLTDFRATGGQLCRAGTWPMKEKVKTGSRDGEPVAPLLGAISDYDESVTSGCFGFLSYLIAYCDYAAAITYVPVSAAQTKVEFSWLVRKDAEDVDPGEVRWLWDVTTRQDKELIELNAQGVRSKGYRPGPYSNLEQIGADFLSRYVDLMRRTHP
jgi:phenylpropionate dioxygenase-like ring-hydroxylating dioxygenase large terminal subunit